MKTFLFFYLLTSFVTFFFAVWFMKYKLKEASKQLNFDFMAVVKPIIDMARSDWTFMIVFVSPFVIICLPICVALLILEVFIKKIVRLFYRPVKKEQEKELDATETSEIELSDKGKEAYSICLYSDLYEQLTIYYCRWLRSKGHDTTVYENNLNNYKEDMRNIYEEEKLKQQLK